VLVPNYIYTKGDPLWRGGSKFKSHFTSSLSILKIFLFLLLNHFIVPKKIFQNSKTIIFIISTQSYLPALSANSFQGTWSSICVILFPISWVSANICDIYSFWEAVKWFLLLFLQNNDFIDIGWYLSGHLISLNKHYSLNWELFTSLSFKLRNNYYCKFLLVNRAKYHLVTYVTVLSYVKSRKQKFLEFTILIF